MKNMKIGKRLILSFLLVTIISCISGVLSVALMKDSDTKYSDALVMYGFSQGDIGLLMSSLNDNCANMVMSIASDNPTDIQNASQNIQDNTSKINTYIKAIEPTLVGQEEKDCYQVIMDNLPEFSEHVQEIMNLAKQNKNEEALALYNGETMDHIHLIQQATQKLMDSNKTNGTALSHQLTQNSLLIIYLVIAIIAVSVVISLLIAVVTSRSISRPLDQCSQRIAQLANGDLSSPLPLIDAQNEIGVLSKSTRSIVKSLQDMIHEMTHVLGEMAKGNLNISHDHSYPGDFAPLHTSTAEIIQALNETLSKINQPSDQVSGGADQVSNGAQALSQGATEQASSIQQLASAINEISQQVQDNSSNAQEASGASTRAASEVEIGSQKMKEMVDAIQNISDTSNQINKIIKTIEDIAFQTNILALNAAVEAARAGAAGKGFAVVADEVRNLASKSAEAAKNTTMLIETSIQAVDNGTQIASDTAQSLSAIVESTEQANQLVRKIADASAQQAESINQVTQGIDQISSVVQTNSATAEESAAASEELSSQAQVMKSLVERFHLKQDSETLQGNVLPRSSGIRPSMRMSASPMTSRPALPSTIHLDDKY